MQKSLLTLFFLTGTCALTYAQPKPAAAPPPRPAPTADLTSGTVFTEAAPQTVGLSAERLQRIDRVVQEYVDKKRVPGAVTFIARHGKIVQYKAYGLDDAEANTPLKRDAIFRIASQTKAITSLAVLMLYEEGRFLLDDPISRYLPEFRNPKVLARFNPKDTTFATTPAKREVTIRHLLTHTSGISYPSIGTREANAIYAKARIPSGIGTPNGKLADAMKVLGAMPLMHQPGERFTYGLSSDVLGYLVEVLSGQSLDQFFKARIFEPLGMKDTYFYLPADKAPRLTTLYTEDTTRTYRKTPARGNSSPDYPKQAGTYFSGGAGLVSTAYDYAIFLQMLLNGGEYNGKRILSPAVVRMMTSNQIGDLTVGSRKFGLGFALATPQEAARIPYSEGTFEWGGIFGTTYWVDPKEGLVALIMTQKFPNSHNDLTDKFKVLVYQAISNSEQPMMQAGR